MPGGTMGGVQRLGPPYVLTRLVRGIYRFEVRLSGTPDSRWVRQVLRCLAGAAPPFELLHRADVLVFEARGAELPARVARLDAAIRFVNDAREGRRQTAGDAPGMSRASVRQDRGASAATTPRSDPRRGTRSGG